LHAPTAVIAEDQDFHPRVRRERSPRLLVVDDDAEFLELAGLLLSGEGIQVMAARTALEAIRLARRAAPDLVLCDLVLPGAPAGGLDVLAALRSSPRTRGVPIFAMSGEVGDGPGVLAAGFDALFPKPVNWPRLRDLVRRLLGVEGRGRPPV